MKLLLGGLLLFCILASPCSGQAEQIPWEEVPMYGYDHRPMPPEEKIIHDKFLQDIDKTARDRKSAAQHAIARAWEAYRTKDVATAMRRFNQAWLLDSGNAEIFFGFALLVEERGKREEATGFYRRALSLNPKYEMVMTNLAGLYIRKATDLGQQYLRGIRQEYYACLSEAEDLLAAASQISVSDEKELGYVYYKWAVVSAMKSDFEGAWRKVRLSRRFHGEIDPGFIARLSRDMPEPKE